MKKITLLTLAISSLVQSKAQFAPALQSLVDAERAFAQRSIDQSIRSAFLANFDENSIAFKKGEPVQGLADWKAREESDAYLYWWPVFADIASSGEFGYTTGPAEWGEKRIEKKGVGGIYYASVWRKDHNGRWKILADLGSAVYSPGGQQSPCVTTSRPLKPARGKQDATRARVELMGIESKYLKELSVGKQSFAVEYFSDEGRIHRPGMPPVTGNPGLNTLTESQKFTFEPVAGEVATSADMGFTYGRVKILAVRDGKEMEMPACYMHVWKKDEGKWQIVLDVIGGG